MICFYQTFNYICYGYSNKMRLDYNSTVHKTLLYPVWERESSTSQDILVSWPLYPNIRGYVENVFFPLLGRAATPKKKSLMKSTPIEILIARQGNKQAAQRHKIRPAVFYLRDKFLHDANHADTFSESLSLES